MKLHSLITAVALGMATQIQAQEKSSTPVSPKPVPAVPDPFAGGDAPRTKPAPKVTTGAAPPKETSIAKPSHPTIRGSVDLPAGKLGEVVAEIERGIGSWDVAEGAAEPTMPNIIFTAESRDAVVPTVRLQGGVSPVQAIALVCAAAGCSMEPIFAPAEGTASPAQVQPIIGYRIVRESAQKFGSVTESKPITFTGLAGGEKIKESIAAATTKLRSLQGKYTAIHPSVIAGEKELVELKRALERSTVESKLPVSGIGVVLEKKDGGVVVTEILPGSPVSAYPEIKPGQRILGVAEDGKPAVDTTSATIEFLVKLLRGEPGTPVDVTFGTDSDKGPKKHTVKLVRTGLPIPDPNVISGVPIVKAIDNTFYLASLPTDEEKAIVRVYALRGILGGDPKDYGENERACEELIAHALDKAGLRGGKERPDLSFHMKSRVLLVKATAAQQEVILQIIEAMKENETQPIKTNETLTPAPMPIPDKPAPDVIEKPEKSLPR